MKFGISRLIELPEMHCVQLKRSLGFSIGHYKPDFNRLKTRCDKQFDTGPLLISAVYKEVHLNGNSSARMDGMNLGPCQSAQKTTVEGKNKQPLISCKPPESGESSQYRAPAALSAGNPLWI